MIHHPTRPFAEKLRDDADDDERFQRTLCRLVYQYGSCTISCLHTDPNEVLEGLATYTKHAIAYRVDNNGNVVHAVLATEDVSHLGHNDRINHMTGLRQIQIARSHGRTTGIIPANQPNYLMTAPAVDETRSN